MTETSKVCILTYGNVVSFNLQISIVYQPSSEAGWDGFFFYPKDQRLDPPMEGFEWTCMT